MVRLLLPLPLELQIAQVPIIPIILQAKAIIQHQLPVCLVPIAAEYLVSLAYGLSRVIHKNQV